VTLLIVDDAISTMRERVDALGVAEPEIQRSGDDQISVGLPDVQDIERARQQVGTTAKLQFYDWEPNILTDTEVYSGGDGLYDATLAASKQEGKAEQTDVVPGSGDTPEEADRKNNTQEDRYYLFGPDRAPIGPDKQPIRTETYEPSASCRELLAEYDEEPGDPNKYAKGTECLPELEALGPGGPPDGSRVIKVPAGVIVVEQERAPNQPPQLKRFTVLEDDSELSGEDIKNPEANTDPNTSAPVVQMEFSDEGREAFARVTKRIAERGFNASTLNPGTPADQFLQSFAITLDDQIVSLATIDFRENPEGIDGRTGAQIEGVGSFDDANDLAESLRIGALPIELKLVSETQVSATLGQQALDQGLAAGIAGFIIVAVFLIVFYRVMGLIAVTALCVYAVYLFAFVLVALQSDKVTVYGENTGGFLGGLFTNMVIFNPTFPIRRPDGAFFEIGSGAQDVRNPYAMAVQLEDDAGPLMTAVMRVAHQLRAAKQQQARTRQPRVRAHPHLPLLSHGFR
jgi:SecD/SecF fusion protein